MSQVEVDYRDCDREIWEEELADFVPSRILDAHIHCYWDSNYPEGPPFKGPPNLTGADHDLETLNRCAAVRKGYRLRTCPLGLSLVHCRILIVFE